MLILWVATAWADCPADAPQRVAAATESVEYAFATLNEVAFAQAQADLYVVLPCVSRGLTPSEVGAVHRAQAYISFFYGKDEQVVEAFAAVRASQPLWEPSPTVIPVGHPLRNLWEESKDIPIGVTGLPYVPPGGWLVDGASADVLPMGRPFVLQPLDFDGGAVVTWYQWDTSLPGQETLTFAPAPVERSGKRTRVWGSVVGGSLAVVSGACLVGNLDARDDLHDAPVSEVEVLGRRADRFAASSAVFGGVSAATLALSWSMSW